MHAVARRIACAAALVLTLAASGKALAQAPRTVVLAPATTVGGASSKALRKLELLLETSIAALPATKVIPATAATKATRKAKKPELRTCEGEAKCLVSLGALVGASHVVYAEVSDLGDAQVVYVKALEVSSGNALPSTTLKLGKGVDRKKAGLAAATQILSPNLYTGTLQVQSSVAGATVFVDGHKISTTPSAPTAVYVGSHALRVTHPEHSDYVRFVDIGFQEATVIKAELLGLPGLDQKLQAKGVIGDPNRKTVVNYRDTPWYLRWYTITGGVAAIAITTVVLTSGSTPINADLIHDL